LVGQWSIQVTARMRSTALLALAAPLFAALAGGEAAAGSDIGLSGNWSRTDGEARIHIERCGDSLCAVNTWVRNPAKGELVGDRFVMTVKPRPPATLAGEAFDVRRGLTYSVLISFEQDAMTTKGCLVAGVVCRTMSWTRVP
jgi:uncharacterized protein (DUF2147 family)